MCRLMIKLNNGVKKKGFTLIEIVIVLAIMSVIGSAIYSFITFNYNVYNKGTKNAEKRNEVSTASQFITKQLRYAKDVVIITSIPTPTVGFDDIYLNGNEIFCVKNGVLNSTGIGNAKDLTLSFNKAAANTIQFTVGIADNSAFDITSEVTILNMPKVPGIVEGIGLGVHFSTVP